MIRKPGFAIFQHTHYFKNPAGKKILLMRIPVASGGSGWAELRVEKSPGLKAIGANPEGEFPIVFQQSG